MARFGKEVRTLLVAGVVLGLVPRVAQAQLSSAQTNKEFVRLLFFEPNIAGIENNTALAGVADDSAKALTRLIGVALSTTPVAYSSAGFSLGPPDKVTGNRSLKSESFGPTFADRPLTNGRGVFSFGLNYQYANTKFGGAADVTADGRDVGLPIVDNPVIRTDGAPQFITRRAFLETKSQLFDFLMAYGVTDRLDVGVLVPFLSLKVMGHTEDAWDLSKVSPADRGPVHSTPTGTVVIQPQLSRSASGIGDITARVKYSLVGQVKEGIAVAVDLRFPTGDDEELLGAGDPSVRLQLLTYKAGLGPAAIHANFGYTGGGLSDEINYTIGTDAALLSKKQLTASVSLLGLVLRSGSDPAIIETHRSVLPGGTVLVNRFSWEEKNQNLAQVAAGIKYNVSGRWLVSASVLIPVTNRGMQPKLVPVFGLERTWDR